MPAIIALVGVPLKVVLFTKVGFLVTGL